MITKEQAFGMYIGQKCLIVGNIQTEELITVNKDGMDATTYNEIDMYQRHHYLGLDKCKLILRPFESMTEEEMTKYSLMGVYACDSKDEMKVRQQCISKGFEYLISIGIDVFDFKSRGWAVYEEGSK